MTTDLETLLVVQEHDLVLDRLRHRRATLPARGELADRHAALATGEADVAAVRQDRDAVLADERRLDDEAQRIGAHATEVHDRLYSGTVTSPRELQAMQADLDMLHRQRRDLEDRELEVMERREDLDERVVALDTSIAELRTAIERLATELAAAEAEIDAEIAAEEAQRRAAADGVGAALVADYERRRTRNKGAGAARLVGTTCQACHLSIPSTEAERIRRGGGAEVAYCDNCGAILVP